MRSIVDFLEQESRLASTIRVLVSAACVLIIWQLISLVVTNRLLLVPPADVAIALVKEIQQGAMWTNAVATVGAVVSSFLVSCVIGIAIGLALASSRLLSLTGGPVLSALNSVPIIALAPLFVAWLGLGFVVVTVGTGEPRRLVACALGEPGFIVSGIRVSWARALVGIVVAEFFGSFAGFGFAIMSASQTFDTARVLGYVFVLGAMGLIGSVLFASLERRLAPWRQE